jgi:hypothetical protein
MSAIHPSSPKTTKKRRPKRCRGDMKIHFHGYHKGNVAYHVVEASSSSLAFLFALDGYHSQNRTLNAFKHSRFSPMGIPASKSVSPSVESSWQSRSPFKLRLWGFITNTLKNVPYSYKDSSQRHRVDSQTRPCLSSVSKLTETSTLIRLIPIPIDHVRDYMYTTDP